MLKRCRGNLFRVIVDVTQTSSSSSTITTSRITHTGHRSVIVESVDPPLGERLEAAWRFLSPSAHHALRDRSCVSADVALKLLMVAGRKKLPSPDALRFSVDVDDGGGGALGPRATGFEQLVLDLAGQEASGSENRKTLENAAGLFAIIDSAAYIEASEAEGAADMRFRWAMEIARLAQPDTDAPPWTAWSFDEAVEEFARTQFGVYGRTAFNEVLRGVLVRDAVARLSRTYWMFTVPRDCTYGSVHVQLHRAMRGDPQLSLPSSSSVSDDKVKKLWSLRSHEALRWSVLAEFPWRATISGGRHECLQLCYAETDEFGKKLRGQWHDALKLITSCTATSANSTGDAESSGSSPQPWAAAVEQRLGSQNLKRVATVAMTSGDTAFRRQAIALSALTHLAQQNANSNAKSVAVSPQDVLDVSLLETMSVSDAHVLDAVDHVHLSRCVKALNLHYALQRPETESNADPPADVVADAAVENFCLGLCMEVTAMLRPFAALRIADQAARVVPLSFDTLRRLSAAATTASDEALLVSWRKASGVDKTAERRGVAAENALVVARTGDWSVAVFGGSLPPLPLAAHGFRWTWPEGVIGDGGGRENKKNLKVIGHTVKSRLALRNQPRFVRSYTALVIRVWTKPHVAAARWPFRRGCHRVTLAVKSDGGSATDEQPSATLEFDYELLESFRGVPWTTIATWSGGGQQKAAVTDRDAQHLMLLKLSTNAPMSALVTALNRLGVAVVGDNRWSIAACPRFASAEDLALVCDEIAVKDMSRRRWVSVECARPAFMDALLHALEPWRQRRER